MSKQVKLTAQVRKETGQSAVKKIKSQGYVPAVIYTENEKPVTLQVSERDINTVLAHAVGESLLVELNVAGKNHLALIKEVQHHPVNQKVLHVDFHGVSANKAIGANIPIEPSGEAIGVKAGGVLEQQMRTIAITCLPKDLPELITVDVSALAIGSVLHVKDIALPAGVKAVDNPEKTVFHVVAPKVQEAEAAPVEAAPTAPEVIKEKKPAAAEEKK